MEQLFVISGYSFLIGATFRYGWLLSDAVAQILTDIASRIVRALK